MVVEADVATEAGRSALMAKAERVFPKGLDLLVNNVGTNLHAKASTEYTDDEYDMLQATNQASAFHVSRRCHGLLKKYVVCGQCLVPSPGIWKRCNWA